MYNPYDDKFLKLFQKDSQKRSKSYLFNLKDPRKYTENQSFSTPISSMRTPSKIRQKSKRKGVQLPSFNHLDKSFLSENRKYLKQNKLVYQRMRQVPKKSRANPYSVFLDLGYLPSLKEKDGF